MEGIMASRRMFFSKSPRLAQTSPCLQHEGKTGEERDLVNFNDTQGVTPCCKLVKCISGYQGYPDIRGIIYGYKKRPNFI